MRKIFTILGLLICGISIGAIITYVLQAEQVQNFINLEEQVRSYKAAQTCDQAYFKASPDIAVWQIEHYLADSELESSPRGNMRINYLNSFVANARLGKLYEKRGELSRAKQHISLAMTNYNLACYQQSVISNEDSVFAMLETFDAKALKRLDEDMKSSPQQQ